MVKYALKIFGKNLQLMLDISFYNENRKALERALLVYRKMGIIER